MKNLYLIFFLEIHIFGLKLFLTHGNIYCLDISSRHLGASNVDHKCHILKVFVSHLDLLELGVYFLSITLCHSISLLLGYIAQINDELFEVTCFNFEEVINGVSKLYNTLCWNQSDSCLLLY